jgi:hypothetical protein
MNAEELLRGTLQDKAQDAHDTVTFEEVRRGARLRRRSSHRRSAVLAAAAVVVAVGTPTAFLLRPGDTAPEPAPQPTSSPSPTPTDTSTGTATGLAGVRRGPDPQLAYLHGGVVHEPDGGTTRLPTADDPTQFTPYHGGWLTVSDTGTLTQWDSSGSAVQVVDGESHLAVSADQMRTAYGVPGEIHVGIGSGMGERESVYSVGSAQLVGFVKDGRSYDDVVFNGGDGQVVYIDRGVRHVVTGLSEADASSSGSDLIGGVAPDGVSGRVVDLRGHVQWTSAWLPNAFSPDGRYVAAVLAPDGEGTDLAILDARSGEVVSRVSLQDRGMAQFGRPVWEESDGAVLLQVQDATSQALLRLGRDGSVSLASDIEPSSDLPMWFFMTTP